MASPLRSALHLAALLALVGSTVGAATIEDFERGIDAWSFNHGPEYPGAKGTQAHDAMTVHTGAGALRLEADFSAGGLYVASSRRLEAGGAGAAVGFHARGENLKQVVVRLVDASGQTHQHHVALGAEREWRRLRIEPLASRNNWGGAKDGAWHPPLRSIAFLVEKHQLRDADRPTAILHVDAVELVDTTVAAADAAAAYRIPAGDFEDARDSWWAHHADSMREVVSIDSDSAKVGARSLRVGGDLGRGGWVTAVKQFDQPIDLRRVTGWLRSDNLSRVTLRILAASGQEVTRRIELDPGGGWQRIELDDLPPGDDPARGRTLRLYGAQASLQIAFGADDRADSGRRDAALWLDGIEVVGDGQGPLRVPGYSLLAVGPLSGRIDLPRSLPYFWGPDQAPDAVVVRWWNRGQRTARTAPVELLDHRLRRVALLHPGGEALGPGDGLERRLELALPAYGHYTVATTLEGEPLRARLAWLAAAAEPDPAGKIGVQTHFNQGPWGRSQHIDGAAGAIDLLRRMGAGWVRDDARYEADDAGRMRPEPPTGTDFYPWHRLAEAGIATMMTYVDYSCGNDRQPPHTDAARAEYARRFAALVARYRDRTRVFEVWNEPNIPPGWRGRRPDAGEYAAMMEAAYDAAKAVDPAVTVVGITSCGTDFGYMERVVAATGGRGFDAVSAHPYHGVAPETSKDGGGPNPEWMGEGDHLTFAGRIDAIRDLLAANGAAGTPIWCDEFGYGSKRPADEYRHGLWIVRQYLIAMGLDEVERMVCYTLIDQGWDEDPSSHMTFGLIRSDGSPEPRYVMLNTLARMVHGRRVIARPELGEGIRAASFDGPGGMVHALWTVDEGRTLTLAAASAPTLTDLMGNQRRLTPSSGRVALALTGEPLFLSGIDRLEPAAALITLAAPARATSEDEVVLMIEADPALRPDWAGRAPAGWAVRVERDRLRVQPAADAASGSYELVVHDRRSGSGAATTLELVNEITLRARPAAGPAVAVSLRNPFPRERSLTLRPRSSMQQLPTRELRLPAKGEAAFELTVEPRVEGGWTTVPVALNPVLPAGEAGVVAYADAASDRIVAGVTPCLRLRAQVVDGRADEWAGVEPCLLRFEHQVVRLGGGAWGGPDDCSAQLWTGWDEEAFAVAARVVDDVRVVGFPRDELWKGDSLQVALAIDGVRHEFTLAPFDGEAVVQRSAPRDRRGLVPGVAAAVVPLAGATGYELRIPWSELGIVAADRERVRLAVVINDNDRRDSGHHRGGREGYLEWFTGLGADKDASRYGALHFLRAP